MEWEAEFDADGNGEFYLPGSAAPTLRLDLLSLESATPLGANRFSEILRRDAEKIEILNELTALHTYSKAVQDRGISLRIHYWEVANVLPPTNARLAIFSLTLLDDETLGPEMENLVATFDDEIRSCEFEPV